MKPIRFFTTIIILLSCAMAGKAQNAIFDKYNDMRNVSSVYISKTMIEMQPDLYTKDLYIGKVAGQLDAVYIVSTRDNTIKKDLRKDIEQSIQKGKYELLMKQKGIVSRSAFYVKRKGDIVKELIMITDGAATLKYVLLSGNLTLQDIRNITNYQNTGEIIVIPENLEFNLADLKELENLKDLDILKDIDWTITSNDLMEMGKELKKMVKELKEELKEEFKDINISYNTELSL